MAKQKNVNVVVITPERQVLDENCAAVVIPAHDGELGILPDRASLMCELDVGQLRYQQAGRTHRLYVEGGFAQVHANRVTVLTSHALPAEQVTRELVAEADKSADAATGGKADDLEGRRKARRRASVLRSLQSAK